MQHYPDEPRSAWPVIGGLIAGMLIGGAIVLGVALSRPEPPAPLCSPRVYNMPESIVRPRPDRQYDT